MNNRILVMTGLLSILIMMTGCAGKQPKAQAVIDGDQAVRIYEVFGMDCPGCHGGLENLVLKIPAVLRAQANWKEQRLVVTVKTGAILDDELVYDAIRKANFTAGKRIQ